MATKTNTRKATASKSVLTKEVKEAIANGNRRVLNKALFGLYKSKVNPDYVIGKSPLSEWQDFISGVIDGSISIKEIESAPDKKTTTKTTKKSTTKSGSNKGAKTNSDTDVRNKLIADYASGAISAEQFANAIIALK